MAKTNSNKVAAVAYTRKSTKGKVNGKERQEKSIDQQRKEIERLAKEKGYKIIRWYSDEGISGWKSGDKRPGYASILHDAQQKGDFTVIVADDPDRFTRESFRKAFRAIDDLAEAGVEVISCVNGGDFRIADETDAGEAHRLLAVSMSSHEHSRKTGRRVTLARRNLAAQGKRSGGRPPYGMADDGDGGLLPGDGQEAETVQWIFDQFVSHHASLNSIAKALNESGTPGPQGGTWYRSTVQKLLKQRAYRGDFTHGSKRAGQFYTLDDKGEVVERNGQTEGPAPFAKAGAYQPLVDPKIFDKAQRRLDSFQKGKRKARPDGYALTGVLVCDHCGRQMHGAEPKGRKRLYRCSSPARTGECGHFSVREDRIIPGLLQILDEEIDALTARSLVSEPPEPAPAPDREAEIEALQAKIDKAVESRMYADDARTRQIMDGKIKELWAEHDRLQAEQSKPDAEAEQEAIQFLSEYWQQFKRRAIGVELETDGTIARSTYPDTSAFLSAWGDETFTADIDSRSINEVLNTLGCEVRLRWRTEKRTQRKRHKLDRGRFRLGQRTGQLACNVAHGSR